MITFSKFLATIKTDVPIELNMEELKKETPDEEAMRKIFDEMEFRTLTERIFGREKKSTPTETSAPVQRSGQLSLFDEPAPTSTKKDSLQGNLFAEFTDEGTNDLKFSTLKSLKDLDFDYQLIDTEEKRKEFIQIIKTKEIFSLDTETTDIDPIHAKLVGMSFSYAEYQAFYVPVPAERDEALKIVNEFKEIFEKEQTLKVGQNIKYDILALSH